MSLFRRGGVWWYEFWFAGRRVQESTKSTSKTIAARAGQDRRRELEKRFNNFADNRHERIRSFSEVATEFYDGYKLRLPDSAVFADYAINHLKRLLGRKMLVDFNEAVVIKYQNDRLDEGTASKTINEEVGFLLRVLGEPGEIIRAVIRERCKIHEPELTLALETGMRRGELYSLDWDRVYLDRRQLLLLKTKNGTARVVILTAAAVSALEELHGRRSKDSPKVCLTRYGEPMISPRVWFELVMEEAVKKNKSLHDVTWHIFRQTYISRLVMAGWI
jgi:integrase